MSDKYEIIPFAADHAIELYGEEINVGFVREVGGAEHLIPWAMNAERGHAWSGRRLSDGMIIGCGGFSLLWPGVADGWVIFRKIMEKEYRRDAYSVILGMLAAEIKEHGIWRIQATVRTDFPAGIKYAEGLGFVREGLMRKYGPDGSDRYLYALVME
jgi:RimJ/RimL family protein N-acetyltransferase